MEKQSSQESKYMRHIPSFFLEAAEEEKPPFIESYLKIFEEILTGIKGGKLKGKKSMAEMLDIISELFHPRFSFLRDEWQKEHLEIFTQYFSADMDGFLVWLASWMSLALKEDWDIEKKRKVIARMIPIYKIRGTKRGLEEYLSIYAIGFMKNKTEKTISISEYLNPFHIGYTSTVGINTIVGDGRPHYFRVHMYLPEPDRRMLEKMERNIREIIELEKPAHTYYDLIIDVPTMQVGIHSTVGADTLLGGQISG